MKCPKCHYVSFDGQQRCRNCGYDFSLSTPVDSGDIPMRPASGSAAGGGGASDLSLRPEPSVPLGGSSPSMPTPPLTPPPGRVPTPMDPSPTGRARISGAYEPPAPRRTGDLPPRQSEPGTRPRMQDTGRARIADDGLRLRADESPRARNTDSDPLDLPLFDPGVPMPADDRPLVSATLPPRPPLSVRRTSDTGTRPRPRVTPQPPGSTTTSTTSTSSRPTPAARVDEPRLDLDFSSTDDLLGVEPDLSTLGASVGADATTTTGTRSGRYATASAAATSARADDAAGTDAEADAAADTDTAPMAARVLAGAIDVAFLLVVDLIVLHFTFRLTGLTFAEWRRLPIAPLAGFLALMHGGYLAMFTAASGQTMGKMVAGLKVVTMRGGAVPFGQAVVRAFVWLLSVPTIVGIIPALLSTDHRALHDRFADTRVIKAE